MNYSYGNVTCVSLQCYTMTATDSISGAITRTDDALDRLASETTPQGTVGYTYDVAGRRSSLTVPGQTVANYTFDNANRLTQITQGSTTVSFSYDNANRRTTLTLPNGITTSYSYDNASQLTGLTYAKGSNTLGNLTYGYDLNGRRTNIGGSFAATNLPNAVSTTAYNANNQLTTWGTANLFYDLNGNMTSDGTHSYIWDARNHLKQIDSGTTASFTYDPLGRRVSKNILGTGTSFLYDGANAVQELIGGTNTANSLMGGIDEVFQRTDSSGGRSFLTDALGSSIALADSSGTIQTQYTFDPFGSTTPSGASTTNSFAYTSRELDSTGLYFNRARYYDPQIQRFISEDSIGFNGGDPNLYAYVGDSPTNYVDPTGEDATVIGLEVGCFAGPEGCLAGAAIGALVDLTILTAAVVGTAYAGYKLDQAIRNVDVGGDDPAFASPEATAVAIAELTRQLANNDLTQREREAIKRRLNELRRRLSKRKHGADKKGFFPPFPGSPMGGRNCDHQ